MIHARKDYNRIQDPAVNDPTLISPGSTPFGEDEPVMLFRAQDKHFTKVISHYMEMVASDMSDPVEIDKITRACVEQIHRAWDWQRTHRVKSPDIP